MSNFLPKSREAMTRILTAASIGLVAVGLSACDKPAEAQKTPTIAYTVQPGDTMSGIVEKQCDVGYPAIDDGITAIRIENNRSGTDISAGEELMIPGDMCAKLREAEELHR